MTVAPKQSGKDILRNLIPLNTLSDEALDELMSQAKFSKLKTGQTLFAEGDTDVERVYLVSGRLALIERGQEAYQISAGDNMARYPLAHHVPRKYTAIAKSKMEAVTLDNTLLGDLLAANSNSGYEVEEVDEELSDDWMSQLLQSPIFQQIPAANIQQVMIHMEAVEVVAGETVIHEGEDGDYFYLINNGTALVTRAAESGNMDELAHLGPGTTFGEESLLSDSPRSSTVTMLSDGVLQRLDKEHFVDFIKTPLADSIDYEDAVEKIQAGAIWVDVRTKAEHAKFHFPNSINIPFDQLRKKASELDKERRYITYCQDGVVSSTAVYLLMGNGYQAQVLTKGLQSVPEEAVSEAAPDSGAETTETGGSAKLQDTQILQNEAGLLRQQLHATEDQVKAHIVHIRKMKVLINKLKMSLDKADQEKKASLSHQEEQNATLEELTKRLSHLEKTQASDEKRLKHSTQDKKSLEKARQELEHANAAHAEAHKGAELAIGQLKQKLQSSEQRSQENEKTLEKKSRSFDELKKAHQDALAESEAKMIELQKNNAQKDVDAGSLTAKVTELQAFVSQAESDQTKLGDWVASLQSELEQATKAIESNQSELANQSDVASQRDQLQSEQTELKSQQEDTQQEIEKLQRAISELESDQKSRIAELETQKNEAAALLEERDGLKRAGESVITELDRLQALEAEQAEKLTQGETERTDLAEQIAALSGEIETLKEKQVAQESAASGEVSGVAAERDMLSAQLESIKHELVDLHSSSDEESKAAAEALSAAKAEHSLLTDQIDQFKQEINTLKDGEADQQQSVDQIAKLVAERDDINTQYQAAQEGFAEQLFKLETERGDLQSQVDAARQQQDELLRNLELNQQKDQSDEVASLVESLDEAKAQLQAREAELATLGAQKAEFQDELNTAHQQQDELRKNLELSQQQKDQSAEIANLVESLDQTKAQLQVREEALATVGVQKSELQHELDALASSSISKDDVEQLRQELEEARVTLSEAEAVVQLPISSDADSESRIQVLEAELKTLNQALDDADSEYESLQKKLEEAVKQPKQDMQGLAQIEALDQALSESNTETDQLREELSVVKQKTDVEVDALKAQIEETEARVKERQLGGEADAAENEVLRQEMDALRLSLKERQTELENRHKEITLLEERIEERNGEVDRVNVALHLAHETLTSAEREKQDSIDAQQNLEEAYNALKQEADSGQFKAELVDPRIDSASLAAGANAPKQGFQLMPVLFAVVVAFGLADLASIAGGKGELVMGLIAGGVSNRPIETSVDVQAEIPSLALAPPKEKAPKDETVEVAEAETTPTPVAETVKGEEPIAAEPTTAPAGVTSLTTVTEAEVEAELKPEQSVESIPESEPEHEVAEEILVIDPEPEEVLVAASPVDEPEVVSEPISEPGPEPVETPQMATIDQSNEPKMGSVSRDFVRSGGQSPDMVYIRGGSFEMGSDRNQLASQERPSHTVAVDSFMIGRYEVTYREYSRFAGVTGRTVPSDLGWGKGSRPVINVSWDDAKAYTDWLSNETGKNYRLPTEAEWEYAAAAGTDTLFWWGTQLGENRANCFNCGSNWDARSTAPVGAFDANEFGVHNSAGNVMEWVADCHHANYDNAPSDGSAWVDLGCRERVVRGGAFNKPGESLRTTRRGRHDADTKLFVLGFRVARDVVLPN